MWGWLKTRANWKYVVGSLIFFVSLFALVFQRKETPDEDNYKGDALESQVNVAPIEEANKEIADVLKPVPSTKSNEIDDAIRTWNNIGG